MNQLELERRFSKKNLFSVLSQEVNGDKYVELILNIEEYRSKNYYETKNARIAVLPESLELAHMIVIEILRCKGEITAVQGIAASIAYKLPMDHLAGVKTALELLAVTDDTFLFELLHANYHGNPTGTLAVMPKVKPSLEALELIEQFRYLPPNLSKPHWSANDSGGMTYFKDHCILGKVNQHNKYVKLDALNILQSIRWQLDPMIIEMEECPNKPLEDEQSVAQFEQMKEESRKIYDMYKDKDFYFIWKYDKRGRMYSCGYHINFQSTDYKKASLCFAKREKLTQ